MTKALISALVLAALAAGCSSGGAHEAGPVPTATVSGPPASIGQTPSAATTEGMPSTSTESTSPIALCTHRTAAVAVASQEGAAGTIRTVWRVTNTSSSPCRSYGFPGMDFHTSSGWLNVHVHRGGHPDIAQPPAPVVVPPGQALYFVSYWGQVDTDAGPCRRFDRVKVTLPDNYVSVKVSASGCVDPQLVYVGPVTTSPPS